MDIPNNVKGWNGIENLNSGNTMKILNYSDQSWMGFEADSRSFWMGVL